MAPGRWSHNRWSMTARLIRLRYPSDCARCRVALLGAKAWDADNRSAGCSGCRGDHPEAPTSVGVWVIDAKN
jgi:hypothetical protein